MTYFHFHSLVQEPDYMHTKTCHWSSRCFIIVHMVNVGGAVVSLHKEMIRGNLRERRSAVWEQQQQKKNCRTLKAEGKHFSPQANCCTACINLDAVWSLLFPALGSFKTFIFIYFKWSSINVRVEQWFSKCVSSSDRWGASSLAEKSCEINF